MHPYYFDPPPEENTGEVSPAVRPAPQEPPGRREGERQPAAHAGPAVRPTRRKSERGAALVLAALTLVLGGTAVLLALRAQPPVDAGAFYPSGGGQASVTPSLSFQAELERAPTGDGTVLSLEAKPEGEGMRLQDIYREVIPSIVSIQATVAKGTLQGVSQGTGILMSGDGYLITNAHVIDGAFRVDVSLEDGRGFQAKLVGSDSTTDLAVLKIEAEGLTPAAFGDSEDMVVGDAVVAIGNPMGEELRGTMTDGILSAINRDMEVDGNPMTLLQTTAALNTGNSGGALVNDQGQVIGITNMKLVSTDADSNTLEGLGFAIPTATVKPVVDSLIQSGHVTGRPTLGVTVRGLYPSEKEARGVACGLLVDAVQAGSDAADKVQAGDILLTANGTELNTTDDLLAVRDALDVGESILFQADREGACLEYSVRLVEQYELNQ